MILQRYLYNKMSKGAFALFAGGTIDIILAGTLKATYKLLYGAGICDFEALNDMFFPVQSIGFIIAGICMIAMLCHRQAKHSVHTAVIPPVFSGTFVFVTIMVAGLGLIDFVLCAVSVRMRKPLLVILFTVSFICSLCMGYLSSRDFTEASMNWITEGVNIIGQGSLFAGVMILHAKGLNDTRIRKDETAVQ